MVLAFAAPFIGVSPHSAAARRCPSPPAPRAAHLRLRPSAPRSSFTGSQLRPATHTPHRAPSAPRVPPQAVAALAGATLHAAASLSVFVGAQRAARTVLAAQAIAFPAPLAAMLALLALALAARAAGGGAAIDKTKDAVFTPAAALLSKWLAVFFVPNLVMLPLAPRLPQVELARIAVIVVVGLAASMFSSVVVSLGLRRLAEGAGGGSGSGAQAAKPASPAAPPSGALMGGLGAGTAVALGASVAVSAGLLPLSGALATLPARLYGLFLTLLAFCAGQRVPKNIRAVLHPLVSCTVLTLSGMGLMAALTGKGFLAVLGGYYTKSRALSMWGGGDVLAALLGPAVVSFALQIDAQRGRLVSRFLEIVGTSLIASIFGLVSSAGLARLLSAGAGVRLLVMPRQVTAPLAVPIAEMLGADVALAATVVAITGLLGANIVRSVLTKFGVMDPVARGLAAGASAHGLGTAAMADEPDAFPFAALAMVLVGIFSTVFVSLTPCRALLIRLALGAAGSAVM